jgi:hypothetical protein
MKNKGLSPDFCVAQQKWLIGTLLCADIGWSSGSGMGAFGFAVTGVAGPSGTLVVSGGKLLLVHPVSTTVFP